MKLIALLTTLLPMFANAGTIYQCAVAKVIPDGVRVNVIESNGNTRANLIFGTTVSGTMYKVAANDNGYIGTIRNNPDFTFELKITDIPAENSNIRGYKAHLRAAYPTQLNKEGYDIVDTDLVCGEKISDRWR